MNDIIFITHHLSGVGGVQKFIEILSKQFLADGHRITVIGMSLPKKSDVYEPMIDDDNYQEHLLYDTDVFLARPDKLLFDSYVTKKSSKKIQKMIDNATNPKIIISNPATFFFLKNVNFKNAQVVIGQMHNSAEYLFESKGMYSLYRYFVKKYYQDLDVFLMLTKLDAEQVYKKLKWNNIDFVENPLPFVVEQFERSRLEKKMVMLGRLDKIKQVDHAIEIVADIFSKIPDWEFDIYGTGELQGQLQDQIDKLHMSDRIHLKGFTKSITPIYQEASLTLLTSQKEGLPMSIMESMAYGVPVIAYNCSPGVAQLVEDGGILVDLNDKVMFKNELYQLMEDRQALDEYSQKSFELIKIYEPPMIAKKWYEFFLRGKKQ